MVEAPLGGGALSWSNCAEIRTTASPACAESRTHCFDFPILQVLEAEKIHSPTVTCRKNDACASLFLETMSAIGKSDPVAPGGGAHDFR